MRSLELGEPVRGEKPHCPHCDGIELRRMGRNGFLQRAVLPRFGFFPWECGLCRKIYMLKLRTVDAQQDVQQNRIRDSIHDAIGDRRDPLHLELHAVPGPLASAAAQNASRSGVSMHEKQAV